MNADRLVAIEDGLREVVSDVTDAYVRASNGTEERVLSAVLDALGEAAAALEDVKVG